MKKEKVILSFIAVVLGILVTAIVFYLYQGTKNKSAERTKTITVVAPSPTPKSSIFLTLLSPQDESVVDKKIITISGTTQKDAVILVLTPVDEQIAIPSPEGNFSTTVNIDDGENIIEVTAIAQNGEDVKVTRTVTFSTEEF